VSSVAEFNVHRNSIFSINWKQVMPYPLDQSNICCLG